MGRDLLAAVGAEVARRHRQVDAAGSDIGGADRVRHWVRQGRAAEQQLDDVAGRNRAVERDGERRVGDVGDVVGVRGPESEPAIRSGVPPVGAVVSRVIASAEVVELLPAVSLKWAEICLLPSAPRSPAVTVRLTLPAMMSAALIVCVTGCAKDTLPSSSSTMSPAATVPLSATVNVGLVMSVMLSRLDAPESDAAIRSGVLPVGAVASIVTPSAAEAGLKLPAVSACLAVTM